MLFLGIDLAWGETKPGKPANPSGVVALAGSGEIMDAGLKTGLDEVAEWVSSFDQLDISCFVDAPLVVNNASGMRECEREVGQRYGRWKVSANSTNKASPNLGGVSLRKVLEQVGWRYDDGLAGPPTSGRTLSESYPYTTIVGVEEFGYEDERPRYKRLISKGISRQDAREVRRGAFDQLIRRTALLVDADPPLRLESHPETRQLVTEASPLADRDHKNREDLFDAAICAWTASFWSRHSTNRCQILGASSDEDGTMRATIIAPCRPAQRRPGNEMYPSTENPHKRPRKG